MNNKMQVKIYFNDNSTFTGSIEEASQFMQDEIGNLKIDRSDGPAIEYSWGTKIWFKDGFQHREGGPAVEYPDGSLDYLINGYLHREDGPARVFKDRPSEWYIEGSKIHPALVSKILKYKRKSSLLPFLLDSDHSTRILAQFRLKELEELGK